MSDTPLVVAGDILSFQLPPYFCQRHGSVNGLGYVALWGADGKETGRYCMACYQDLVRRECCEIKEAE